MAMKPSGFKPVRGKSISIKLEAPKPTTPKPTAPKPGISRPVTPGKLARSAEADDVLITTRKSPDVIRTTVSERMTPMKKKR